METDLITIQILGIYRYGHTNPHLAPWFNESHKAIQKFIGSKKQLFEVTAQTLDEIQQLAIESPLKTKRLLHQGLRISNQCLTAPN